MSTYKLTYFNVTALGEPIRFLLSHAGVDFQDIRLSFEEWPRLKPTMPMEQLPTLEVDGKVYFQSRAIGRYLAKKFGLYSDDDLIAMQIDAVVDTIEDLRMLIGRFVREQNPEYKEQLKATALEKYPMYLEKLEEFAKSNKGYLATDKLTWADICFAASTEFLSNVLETDIVKDYPTLKNLKETIFNMPNIKKYLDNRPKAIF